MTILDEDAPPTLTLSSGWAVPEGDSGPSTHSFTLTLSALSERTVQVSYTTANGTATEPSDYLGTWGTSTIPPGTLSVEVPFTITGDTVVEPWEWLALNLSAPVAVTRSPRRAATPTSRMTTPDRWG